VRLLSFFGLLPNSSPSLPVVSLILPVDRLLSRALRNESLLHRFFVRPMSFLFRLALLFGSLFVRITSSIPIILTMCVVVHFVPLCLVSFRRGGTPSPDCPPLSIDLKALLLVLV